MSCPLHQAFHEKLSGGNGRLIENQGIRTDFNVNFDINLVGGQTIF
jgi:hypothetical protein